MKIQERFFNSEYGEQYAITLQFQLQRQREKNKILQQRLRNKQIFIVEMKKMHGELQLITERCRLELIQQRQKRQQMEKSTLRSYIETIHELQHKIKYLQTIDAAKQISHHDQYHHLHRNKSAPKYHYYPKDPHHPNLPIPYTNPNPINKKIKDQNLEQKHNDSTQVFNKFINRFLQMFSIYNQMNYEVNIKKKLKISWKWIKQVVKQWQQHDNILTTIFKYCQKCLHQRTTCRPQNILKLKHQDPNQPKNHQC